jgi:hypothetical protein
MHVAMDACLRLCVRKCVYIILNQGPYVTSFVAFWVIDISRIACEVLIVPHSHGEMSR